MPSIDNAPSPLARRHSRWMVALATVVVLGLTGGFAIVRTTAVDTDRDGLPDVVETHGWKTRDALFYQTDPGKADTDGDGVTDGEEAGSVVSEWLWERVYTGASDPAKPDSDDDGLTDKAERYGWRTQSGAKYSTQPMNPDTDGDGLFDGDEAGVLVAGSTADGIYFARSNPLVGDTDGDGLDDATEADLDLDAFDSDSDDDQIDDRREVQVLGTAANVADTDGDGLTDAYEDAHRIDQGLDPLQADTKVDKWDYALDFAKGAIAGDLWREDSIAWLVGNLASGGASFIPGVGWIVGSVADVRDAVGSAINADWVSMGFSAVGLIPDIGDTVALPGKVARFAARHHDGATAIAATVMSLEKVPDKVKVQATKGIWKSWDELRNSGVSEQALLRLQQGRTNLDQLAAASSHPNHSAGRTVAFVTNWRDAEEYLEDLYDAHTAGVNKQVRGSTQGCELVCNTINVRVMDVVANGIAHEAKVGYKTLA